MTPRGVMQATNEISLERVMILALEMGTQDPRISSIPGYSSMMIHADVNISMCPGTTWYAVV